MENQNIPPQAPIGIQQDLPNSTAVLVLGILSIVLSCCFMGILGLVLGIIALVMSAKSLRLYQSNPSYYTPSSYKNMSAGRVCAIIGLVLSAIMLIFMVLNLIFGWFEADYIEKMMDKNSF